MAWSPINHSVLLNSVEINLAGSRWNKIGSRENMFSIKLAKVLCKTQITQTNVLIIVVRLVFHVPSSDHLAGKTEDNICFSRRG